jgi:hypothetical protein
MTSVEQIVGTDDSGEAVGDLRVKPALRTLLVDQQQLVDPSVGGGGGPDHGVRDGFPSRRALLSWYQRAAVRTLGNIAERFPPESCVGDETLLSGLLTEPDCDVELMGDRDAAVYRRMFESTVVQPACSNAYRGFRTKAAEYVKSEEREGDKWSPRKLDPESQASIAMRPGFQTLDEQQYQTLSRLWGGFETVDDLLDWTHSLNAPSNGDIDDNIAEMVTVDDTAVAHLVGNRHDPDAAVYREAFAASIVLPSFVAGVRSMNTEELAKTSSSVDVTLRDE